MTLAGMVMPCVNQTRGLLVHALIEFHSTSNAYTVNTILYIKYIYIEYTYAYAVNIILQGYAVLCVSTYQYHIPFVVMRKYHLLNLLEGHRARKIF